MRQTTGAQDPLLGQVVGDRFLIQQRIGEGGMGVVYRAQQVSVDRPVALKVLTPALARDAGWVQRFINEARAISKLKHPNTVQLFDFGQTRDGLLFMAMEFLDGQPLRDVIAGGPLQPPRVIKIIMQICSSLSEAHGLGIIHRDIKPDNVFLLQPPGSPDFVKVLDFSVAKLLQQGAANPAMQTRAGVVFGTPQYMSPEQGRGMPLDARADLYALGILAFEMLIGRVPFNSPAPLDVLAMHVRTPTPPMTNVPEPLARVVLRALEKEPDRRQQSAQQLSDECAQALSQLDGGRMSSWAPQAAMPRMTSERAAVPTAPADAGTVVLEDSAGVVSFARQGGQPMAQPIKRKTAPPQAQSSGILYWALWVLAGIVVGLLTYVAITRVL